MIMEAEPMVYQSSVQLEIAFSELQLTRDKILKSLGYSADQAPPQVSAVTEELLEETAMHCEIRGGYMIVPEPVIDYKSGRIQLSGVEFYTRKIVTNQLINAEKLALFVCTLGPGVGEWSKVYLEKGDYLEGYIVDKIGSLGVEKAMDLVQRQLADEMINDGLKITHRYSPGYCNWHVSEQQQLFKLLPADFCGVTLSPSSLMEPIKSVSGIIGIGRRVEKNDYQCRVCEDQECIMRRSL